MIQTKVARVVSPTELILAAGSEEGVEEGMEFVVYSLSDAVTDPDTGEDLGRIEIVKARVIAAHVQERMTVARTKSRTVSMPRNFIQHVMNSDLSFSIPERMNLENTPSVEPDLIVRVGDVARTVTKPVPVAKPELVLS